MSIEAAPLMRMRALPDERRRFQRVRVALLGRYMLSDHQEYPCQTIDMSPGGVAVIAAVSGRIGERVVFYLEHIGRVEGTVARKLEFGFAASLTGTHRKRDKIASQLTWLANRQALGLPEDRRHERVAPVNMVVDLKLESGRIVTARLIDVSLSGAALSTDHPLAVGTPVTIGKTPGKIIRHFNGGMAVEFLLPLSPDRFDENVVL